MDITKYSFVRVENQKFANADLIAGQPVFFQTATSRRAIFFTPALQS
jgi:hypothetical protein